MKRFQFDEALINRRGQFYPTGHILAMFPSEDAARDAARALADAGVNDDEIAWLPPEVFLQDLARSVGTADVPLPSAGTEGDTIRQFVEFAAQGHHGLLLPSPDHGQNDAVIAALEGARPTYAQRFTKLIIEDLAA